MVAIAQRPSTARPPDGTPLGNQAWSNASADASKAYHATGEWGKRGMTFQELTRAFDAFNEAEERVAIGFAWSEDCSRKLEEPLSGVKTVFSDLDGLRPLCPLSVTPPSSSSSSASTTPISSYQPSTLRPASFLRASDEFEYSLRSFEVKALCDGHNSGGIGGSSSAGAVKVDEDTIKPSHKRRRTLSVISPPTTPLPLDEDSYDLIEDPADDLPPRPSSRLGFFDRRLGEDDSDPTESDRASNVHNLEKVSSRDTCWNDAA